MVSLYLIFYAGLELRFPDVETNPGAWRPVPEACRILCSNERGLSKNLCNVTVASSQYDLLLCSETMVSDRHHMSELLVPGFGHPALLCQDGVSRAFRQPKFECDYCEMLVFRVCGARLNFYLFSLYLNPDLDDRICDC